MIVNCQCKKPFMMWCMFESDSILVLNNGLASNTRVTLQRIASNQFSKILKVTHKDTAYLDLPYVPEIKQIMFV